MRRKNSIERHSGMTGGTQYILKPDLLNDTNRPRRTPRKRAIVALVGMTGIVGLVGMGASGVTPLPWSQEHVSPQPQAVASHATPTTASANQTAAVRPAARQLAALRFAPARTQPLPLMRRITLNVARGDSLSMLLERAGLPSASWISLLQLGAQVDALRHLHPGDVLHATTTAGGALASLTYEPDPRHTLHITRADGRWTASTTHSATRLRIIRVAGHIQHSLLAASQRLGVNTHTAANLAHILRWRIDLSHSIHPGDRFVLIYQQRHVGDQLVGSGPILAAKIATDQGTVTAFRYTDEHGHDHYYDADGKTLRPSIMRTPVDYTRVSSHFSLHRYNPVLHVWRPHYGVDLAAPKGTPIKAAANGHVKFVGRKGGYGRLVILDNFGPYSTRYGHMSRFAGGLQEGDYVKQGQVIGYVGESGVATGPHLHFEIRVNGVAKPPLKVDLPSGAPIADSKIAAFHATIAPLVAELDSAPAVGRTLLARQTPATGQGSAYAMVAALGPTIDLTPTDSGIGDGRDCRKPTPDGDAIAAGACLG